MLRIRFNFHCLHQLGFYVWLGWIELAIGCLQRGSVWSGLGFVLVALGQAGQVFTTLEKTPQ